MTSESDVKGALETAKEKYGDVNVAVNCAGVGIAMRTLSKRGPHPLDEFQVCVVCPSHYQHTMHPVPIGLMFLV